MRMSVQPRRTALEAMGRVPHAPASWRKAYRSMIRMFRSMLDNGDIRGNLLTSRNLKGAFSEIKRLRLVRNILEEGITARGSWSL